MLLYILQARSTIPHAMQLPWLTHKLLFELFSSFSLIYLNERNEKFNICNVLDLSLKKLSREAIAPLAQ